MGACKGPVEEENATRGVFNGPKLVYDESTSAMVKVNSRETLIFDRLIVCHSAGNFTAKNASISLFCYYKIQ